MSEYHALGNVCAYLEDHRDANRLNLVCCEITLASARRVLIEFYIRFRTLRKECIISMVKISFTEILRWVLRYPFAQHATY
jgi:hypothetical protein